MLPAAVVGVGKEICPEIIHLIFAGSAESNNKF